MHRKTQKILQATTQTETFFTDLMQQQGNSEAQI